MSSKKQQDLADLAKAAENMAKTSQEFVENATKPVDPIAKAEANRQAEELQAQLRATLEAQATQQAAKTQATTSSGGADVQQQKPVDRPANAAGKSTSAPPTSPIPVKRGRIFKPRKIIIHGDPGSGKTFLTSDIDGVLLFDLNNGSEMFDVPRYQFRPGDDLRGHVPDNLVEFIGGVRRVRQAPAGVKAVAVDMYTDLERLAMAHILKRDAAAEGKERLHSLESYGYGKGRQVLYDQVREVLSELEKLTAVGVSVILVCHSEVVRHANPHGADYDRSIIRALNTKEISLSRYLYGWSDEVFFLHFDDRAGKIGGRGSVKGITSGDRILECDHGAAHDAKSRLPLPPRVKVGSANPWKFMQEALDRAYRMTPAEIRQEIQDELTRIGDPELAVNVDKAVSMVGDNLDKLTAYMQELRRRPAKVDESAGQEDGDPI